ncbi:MAG: hypothetical protein JSS86_17915, partial [Cyanobacteria bacterium SZAS LIN-2]|nr:hypothetical protein [Cyanobacteria bacterium SZAS LIN-2]
MVFAVSLANMGHKDEPYTYSRLMNLLHEGKASEIQQVTFTNGENTVMVKLNADESSGGAPREKTVIVPAEGKEDLLKELNAAKVKIDSKDVDRSGVWFSMLST